ncbi:MAG: hypothetical protein LQ346_000936 [Caloplaca aetnensis]|nr:MAG: hypothetical protein LQ346_000936 [Caloplaca aetnensis]
MAQKSFRKSQLVAFNNAAAGHDGVLSDRTGAVVVKPCCQAEIDFYQSTAAHPLLLPFIPTFIGTLALNSDPQVVSALTPTAGAKLLDADQATPIVDAPPALSHAPVVEKAWAPSNGGKITTDLAIVLENVTGPFKKPNILDVKLGARLWDDEAPPAKRAKLDKVAEETTSKPLGFRIAGMRTWQGQATATDGKTNGLSEDGYKLYDKNYGRQFSASTVRQGFEDFFLLEKAAVVKGSLRKIINRFLEDLEALKLVLEREESRMYSASLLFVYEGDPEALKDAFLVEKEEDAGTTSHETHEESDDEDEPKPGVQALKLIDFAHAQWTPGQGRDENLLHGLGHVIEILEGLVVSK